MICRFLRKPKCTFTWLRELSFKGRRKMWSLGKVLELDPKFPDVYWVCGRYFYDEKQFGTALVF